jgi:hypothetical protein
VQRSGFKRGGPVAHKRKQTRTNYRYEQRHAHNCRWKPRRWKGQRCLAVVAHLLHQCFQSLDKRGFVTLLGRCLEDAKHHVAQAPPFTWVTFGASGSRRKQRLDIIVAFGGGGGGGGGREQRQVGCRGFFVGECDSLFKRVATWLSGGEVTHRKEKCGCNAQKSKEHEAPSRGAVVRAPRNAAIDCHVHLRRESTALGQAKKIFFKWSHGLVFWREKFGLRQRAAPAEVQARERVTCMTAVGDCRLVEEVKVKQNIGSVFGQMSNEN